LTVRRTLSGLLIGLGLLLTLATVATGLADARREGSPFDSAAGSDLDSQGFEPILVPEAGLDEPRGAPTLLPSSSGNPNGDFASASPPSATPVSPYVTQQGATDADSPATPATNLPIWVPDRIVIPAIQLDAPIVPAQLTEIEYLGIRYQQWLAPDRLASGWHATSAPLGIAGNTVLNGHHNVHGEVFGHLVDLKPGDLIWVYSGKTAFVYRIVLSTILRERWQPASVKLANARWIQPSQDERLTLITCWPYESNTHRLIVVALPASTRTIEDYVMVPRATPHPKVN
jgi:LPXTG-site transpeptidase (sortase) family protein